ncbi:PREDICTED: putative leucine-rich repeat receptor-like serine/threonine-protein kinase At2g24130 [Camelina sativa]|uniref:Leucine-rich repeat receptor-like serine/threonine-protein kinase At2g24130 n=1 Tax=Camelina sativa TaxID=90675 RepID=A0ABM0TPL4_CAMSA|nr:PREDICTED: putative leucine-rich repeat receptor-like serine/threonine-protein kinase At2g24130 [Camelina sativa]
MSSCSLLFISFLITVMTVLASKENDHELLKSDLASLLSFKSVIVSDPHNSLSSWVSVSTSSSVDVCKWSGVKCNKESTRVIELDISGRDLSGVISPSIANLTALTVLDLSRNFFVGKIPQEIGSLHKTLKQLSLSENLLQENIPQELGSLNRLVYLDLGSNRLTGSIPVQLFCNGSSSSLQYIDLSNNSLTGEIPLKKECHLKELRFLLLWSNKLVGTVPSSLSNSTNLKWMDLESNLLTGELPSQVISKMPQLQFLYLSYNHFVSHNNNTNLEPFFSSLANSPDLQELELAGNSLGGEISSSIRHLSVNLVQIHLEQNRIHGSIPPEISNLLNLTLLNLSSNLLTGPIPRELCKLNKLERVYLSNNLLTGEIPMELGEIPRLGLLDVSRNKLSGSIPDSFANLSQLRRLLLYGNHLSGMVPQSLGKCINLEILDLSHNNLSGKIPVEVVSNLRNLKLYLNLSSNHLSGGIPLELSKMDMVLSIDLSSNKLSGKIPPQLGSCIALEHLNLSRNGLFGTLPTSIGQLPYLKELDVSFNRLNGAIPPSFQQSSTLKNLNFSFNLFYGNVSDKGSFSKLSIESFLGDTLLCGSIKGMQPCKKKHKYTSVLLPVLLSLIATPFLCFFGYPLVQRSRFGKNLTVYDKEELEDEEKQNRNDPKYPRISYQQLIAATGGFNASSLIGSGRFGHVYKGVLRNNTKIAVKVLDPKTAMEFSGSFKRECQILKRTKHRNLIKIITTCSKPGFKALVLPLMPNGSLERHLYPGEYSSKNLDLIQLVNICSDVTEGIAYLHHYSPVKVVHCDLKPSNILLDDEMTALVTDFGISRFVQGVEETVSTDDSVSFGSPDGLLCGSVGYIAPEYGMGKRASTHGDVYSFGVLLLEIVSGRRPTDVLVNEGSSLHEFMKSHYPNSLEGIIEQALLRWKPQGKPERCEMLWREVIMEMIELGLICTQYNPSTRPDMLDVAHEMGRLKEYLFACPSLFHISSQETQGEASS